MTTAAKPIDWFWQAWLAAVVFVFPIARTPSRCATCCC
jgi:hypothetical protein